MISITKKTGTANTTYSKGRSIKYIAVHYTAGTTSAAGKAANTAAYFAKSSTGASADFIVDDATIVQYNPDIKNRYCWAVGGSKQNTKGGSLYGVAKNANCINVEICSTNSTGKVKSANDSTWSFTDAVLKNAADLVKYLMETYSIDVDHVIRHYDCTGKCCPGVPGWNADSGSEAKWKSFKAGLTESTTTTTESVSYVVRVTTVPLNIRKGPGTGYDIAAQITTNGAFTIVEESEGTGSDSGWGLLKSYQTNRNGWISLDYATKV